MLKWILISILALVFLIGALAVFFIFTFDADQYRPMIIQEVEKAIQKPVDLRAVSLGWKDGISLTAEGVAVYESRDREPLLQIESIHGALQVSALLKGKLHIGSLVIDRPRVVLVHPYPESPDPVGISDSKPNTPAGSSAALPFAFLMDVIMVKNGKFIYRDTSLLSKPEFEVSNIDFEIKNVALNRPMKVKGRASVMSRQDNLEFETTVTYDLFRGTLTLEDGSVRTDLDGISMSRVAGWIPDAGGLESSAVRGQVEIDLDKLILKNGARPVLNATALLRNGKYVTPSGDALVSACEIEAAADSNQIQIRRSSASVAGGAFSASGAIRDWMGLPALEFAVTLRGLKPENIFVPENPQEPYLTGIATLSVEGAAPGSSWENMDRALAGRGQLILEGGILKNVNILQEVFNGISVVPKLSEKLKSRLPPEYESKFQAKDTVLKPANVPFTFQQRKVAVPQVVVEAEGFGLNGSFLYGLEGSMEGSAMLSIEPGLSEAIESSIEELAFLKGADGRMEIPVNVQGSAGDVRIFPDLVYVGKKIAAVKAREWIQDLLKKGAASGEGSAGDEPQSGASAGTGETDEAANGSQADSGSSAQPKSLVDLLFDIAKEKME